MKTQVIMERKLFNNSISQQSKTGFFSATELVKAGNNFRKEKGLIDFNLAQWLNTKQTKEFILALEKSNKDKVIIKGRGRNSHTWVHPFLFIDIALAINPELKIEVYSWLYDELLKYRNNSGDSYKKMAGALWLNCSNKSTFTKGITKVAEMIKQACNVNDWQKATEKQLELRDKIHNNIALLCDVLKNNNDAIRIGIQKSL